MQRRKQKGKTQRGREKIGDREIEKVKREAESRNL